MEAVELVADDAVDVLVPLDEEAPDDPEEADEPEEPVAAAPDVVVEPDEPEELEDGAVGWKVLLPTPKPIFEAKKPPTVTVSVVFCPVMTRSPLLLSQAETCALP